MQNKNWTPFSGWPDSPLFVPCPLFPLLPIWHYLANLFVVIRSLFNSVFACLFICLNVYREQKCVVCFQCLVRRFCCCSCRDQTRESSCASPTCPSSQIWYGPPLRSTYFLKKYQLLVLLQGLDKLTATRVHYNAIQYNLFNLNV